MNKERKKEAHYVIREITRVKIQAYIIAFLVILFLFAITFLSDSFMDYLGTMHGPSIFGLPIWIFLVIKEYLAINKKAVVFSIDKDGVSIKEKGKKIRIQRKPYRNRNKYRYIYSEDRLVFFEWRDVEQIGFRIISKGYGDWYRLWELYDKELFVFVKSKTKREVLCSIRDYCWSKHLSARRIRQVIYDCTGRSDLFVDETRKQKEW